MTAWRFHPDLTRVRSRGPSLVGYVAAIVAAWLLLLSAAFAQALPAPGGCFARVAETAKRLQVKPHVTNGNASILLPGCDGKQYELLGLVNALLDRLEKGSRK